MSKRKIIVDGEVKLVSRSEWLRSQESQPVKKPKIKKIHIEPDPVNEDFNTDSNDNPTEE